jgi:hypothetical protein
MNLDQYLPVLLFILVGVAVGVIPQVLGWVFSSAMGVRKPDAAKNSPYECGFEAFEDARMKFDVRYYLVAILFILFDLEIVGRGAQGDRPGRLLVDDGFPRHPGGGLRVRMEEGRARLGVISRRTHSKDSQNGN